MSTLSKEKKSYNCREAVITVITAVIAVGKKTTLYYQIVKKLQKN